MFVEKETHQSMLRETLNMDMLRMTPNMARGVISELHQSLLYSFQAGFSPAGHLEFFVNMLGMGSDSIIADEQRCSNFFERFAGNNMPEYFLFTAAELVSIIFGHGQYHIFIGKKTEYFFGY